MAGQITYAEYLPVGDISVITLCLLILALFIGTFIDRNIQFKLFQRIIFFILIGALFGLIYHDMLLRANPVDPFIITVCHDISHISYIITLVIYVYYAVHLVSLEGQEAKRLYMVAGIGFLVLTILEIVGNIFHFGFYVDGSGEAHLNHLLFTIAMVFFVGMIFYLLIRYRNRMIPQISKGIWTTFIICIIILLIQWRHHQSSYTSIVFLMPAIGFMYLLHSNPFDLSTGALNAESFDLAVRDCYRDKDKFYVMYLNMLDTSIQKEFTPQLRFAIYRFYREAIRKPLLFHLGPSQLVLMFREKENKEPGKRIEKVVELFKGLYDEHHLDFKVIIMASENQISKDNAYVDFLQFIENKLGYNEYHYVVKKDIEEYERRSLIVKELEDIAGKLDLNDERVLAYCQPVYNVGNGEYDTAEALMRLNLPGLGILPPERFIALAEKYDLIHELSLIILNKTCIAVRDFLNNGLEVKRISVNFSIQELRDEGFSRDILNIINRYDIPCEKIAIEITESRNERDFDTVKKKMEELREYGMKFYLDDFGTGYSNFERIMELPFDIIKFDRSMVKESVKSESARYMVETFANMFHKLKYRVLYEGVETDEDEKLCLSMYAQYLQGFKYSEPIEIDRFSSYLKEVT